MKKTVLAALTASALCLTVPATASAGPFLGYYKGRNAARAYIQENKVSYTTSAWLNGCWRENRSRILCNYKSQEELDDGRVVCTGQLRAQRAQYLGTYVLERVQYLNCNYRYDQAY